MVAGDQGGKVLAVGGGKGGVGKSFVTAGLATSIAEQGKDTILVDLDLGGANLHTLFGIKTTGRGIGDFIYGQGSSDLAEYTVETGVPHLRLVSGNGFIPGIANLAYAQKIRILKAISRLRAEYVILDLGAGTSYNVVDFFSITQSGIVVTVAEPTAILNAYEFLKNVLFRVLTQCFRRDSDVMELIKDFKTGKEKEVAPMESLSKAIESVNPAAATMLIECCRSFRPGLIINMSRGSDGSLGRSLQDICHNFLGLKVDYLGRVPMDLKVQESTLHMCPVTVEHPNSAPAIALREIAHRCLTSRWLDPRDVQMAVMAHASESEESESNVEGGTKEKSHLARLLSGHHDSDLSGLLSRFLKEYTSDTLVKQEPAVEALELTPWAFHRFEPRMDAQHRWPWFSSSEDVLIPESSPQRGFTFFRKQKEDSTPDVRSILEADHIPMALDNALSDVSGLARDKGLKWLSLGLRLIELHKRALAHRALARAYECMPDYPLVAENYAAVVLVSGQPESVLDILKEGAVRNPNNTPWAFNAGLACFLCGQYEEARDAFQRLQRQGEKNASVITLLAHCEFRLEHYAKACVLFAGLVEQDVRDAANRFNMGICQLYTQQYEEAVSSFTALLFHLPEDAEAWAARGVGYWLLRNTGEAFHDLSAAITKEPANTAFRGLRGALSFQVRRYDKAIEDIGIITQLLPGNPKYQSLLAEIRNCLGA